MNMYKLTFSNGKTVVKTLSKTELVSARIHCFKVEPVSNNYKEPALTSRVVSAKRAEEIYAALGFTKEDIRKAKAERLGK